MELRSIKPLSVNPLKLSQQLGGALALQGFYRSLPIVHGGQGCAAFIRALMTRHYREPVALQSTALQELNVIFGAETGLEAALDHVIGKHAPNLIAVMATSLTEVAGHDLAMQLQSYERSMQRESSCLIVPVIIPDYKGSLESGYAETVKAVLSALIAGNKGKQPKKRDARRINLLPGSHLTPGDVMELKQMIRSFGLDVVAFPDLSTSLSGHLLSGHTAISRGGLPLEYADRIFGSGMTVAIGTSMEDAAKLLESEAGIPYKVFPGLTGLKASDEWMQLLLKLSGEAVPDYCIWQREQLLDGMLDAHFYFAGKRAVVGLEPDHLAAVTIWLRETGMELQGLAAPCSSPALQHVHEQVVIGDFGDLESMAAGADVWISNSHGKQGAERTGCAFVPEGFPIFDRLGSALTVSVGYRGTLMRLIEIGNALIAKEANGKYEGRICKQ